MDPVFFSKILPFFHEKNEQIAGETGQARHLADMPETVNSLKLLHISIVDKI